MSLHSVAAGQVCYDRDSVTISGEDGVTVWGDGLRDLDTARIPGYSGGEQWP